MNRLILIVDDIPLTLDYIRHNLQIAGYRQTMVFDDPMKAVEAVRQGVRPSVLISDFQMPGLNGIELIESVIRIAPDTPSILATADPTLVSRTPPVQWPVIQKGSPRFFLELLGAICTILGHEMPADLPRMIAA